MGLRPVVISGTSIGAAVGALYAAGLAGAEIRYLLFNIDLLAINSMVDFTFPIRSGMIKGKGVENFFERSLPIKRFAELKIPLKIIATDFWNRSQVVLDSGDVIQAVRASISIPGVFKPVKMLSSVLMDGGIVNPVPFDVIRRECDILIAIDVSGTKTTSVQGEIPGTLETIMSTFQIMQASIVNTKRAQTRVDIYLKPKLENIRVLEFHKIEEILNGVKPEVDDFKRHLRKKMKRSFLF